MYTDVENSDSPTKTIYIKYYIYSLYKQSNNKNSYS